MTKPTTLFSGTLCVLLAACGNAPERSATGKQAAVATTQLTVHVRTRAGNYLVADQGGGAALMAYSTWAKGWETFTLTDLDGGSVQDGDTVTLQGGQGQWVSADNGGGGAITVTAPWARGWEQFRIVSLDGTSAIGDGSHFALQTVVGGQYVSVDNGGGSDVTATAPWTRGWETLTLEVVGATPPPPPPPPPPPSGNVTEYAPYFPTWTWDDPSAYPYANLVDLRNKTGIWGVTLAFVLQGSGCSADAGQIPPHADDIQSFLSMGGHVKASFGGADGNYVEYGCGDASSLANAIGAFVDQTGITDLDFDVEQDKAYGLSAMRGQALKQLQDSRGIRVSFTLPTDTTGLASGGLEVVQGALDAGVQILHVNLMTMDYNQFQGQPLGPIAIESLQSAKGQLQSMIGGLSDAAAWGMLGGTPMIGTNDTGEVFSLDDAKQLAQFARDNGLGLVAFWSIDRDPGFQFNSVLATAQP